MEGFDIETLSKSSGLRRIWQTYDILYDVQKQCTGVTAEIYGGPDAFKKLILESKLITLAVSSTIGEIVGGLSCHFEGVGSASLGFLGVKEPYRGRGIGTALMQNVIDILAKKGCDEIKLHCKQDSSVFDFYRRIGFTPTWRKDSRTFVTMRLGSPIEDLGQGEL